MSFDDVNSVPNRPRVKNNFFSAVLLQKRLGKKTDHVVTFDETARFVKQKTTVEVPVEGNAASRAAFDDCTGSFRTGVLQQRIRHAVGEETVGVVVNFYDVERQKFFQLVNDGTRRAVAGVDDDFQRTKIFNVDVTQKTFDVIGHDVDSADGARRFAERPIAAFVRNGGFNVKQTGFRRNGTYALADEFHAVVLFGIVRRGDHDAAVKIVVARREVNHFGADLPNVKNVTARLGESANKRVAQRGTRQANIVPDGNFMRAEQFGKNSADAICQLLIDAFGINAANVVGSEARNVDRHACTLLS